MTTSPSDGTPRKARQVMRDIDGKEIKDDGEKIDLKYVLGHTPNVEDDEDESAAKSLASSDQSFRSAACSCSETVTATTTALIESQFQPVDEDDLEFGDFEDDDDGEQNEASAGRRQRRSSLKPVLIRTPSTDVGRGDGGEQMGGSSSLAGGGGSSSGHSSPDALSMHERKNVRFVDGPGLEERRELVSSDEPPEVPASALKDLKIRRRKRSRSMMTWSLDFEQPGCDPAFIERILRDKVSLENCVAPTDRDQQLTVSGTVRVANVAYDKRVEVRWTVDGWAQGGLTYREVAAYMPGSSDGGTDRFAFLLCPPAAAVDVLHRQLQQQQSDCSGEEPPTTAARGLSGQPPRLEFVLSYEAGGSTYWDNNFGHNYGVVVGASATSSLSSSG